MSEFKAKIKIKLVMVKLSKQAPLYEYLYACVSNDSYFELQKLLGGELLYCPAIKIGIVHTDSH